MRPATDPRPNTIGASTCGCATPAVRPAADGAAVQFKPGARPHSITTAAIPGGESFIGTDKPVIPGDGEAKRQGIELRPYRLSSSTITTAEFQAFVSATGYTTDAEREGVSFVFQTQVGNGADDLGGVHGTPWWRLVRGACWSNVTGARPNEGGRNDHPVVHVSWNDANAFATWVGGRLPTEAEWEHAACSGMGDIRYPWGDEDPPEGGGARCNIWAGPFPRTTDPQRAATGTVPARSGTPNVYGLYNLCGNVWEWTADRFGNQIGEDPYRRVLKGGSFLCHESYCFRYRIAARIGASPNSTTSHQGFRVLFDGSAA